MSKRKSFLHLTIAALVILGAAIYAAGQTSGNAVKQNKREQATKAAMPDAKSAPAEDVVYSYEFSQPQFTIGHIIIEHDAQGRGHISFERQGETEPITDPLELSDSARTRILGLWDALHFLDSDANYQSEKQFPHLGTMKLKMRRGTRERTAEFNWTNDANAKALADEYRRAANQAIFIFDISVARENEPLNSPKLLDTLDLYLARNELSDPHQLIPLIRDLSTDERLPLMARNHAGRILKKLEK
ncbi:MAG: hypothetical protein DMF68_13545 [Acidobacteria bacterium]|nr:MAG: hypothetical protein DMF68_13545 [Acidobacteriota bacterium]